MALTVTPYLAANAPKLSPFTMVCSVPPPSAMLLLTGGTGVIGTGLLGADVMPTLVGAVFNATGGVLVATASALVNGSTTATSLVGGLPVVSFSSRLQPRISNPLSTTTWMARMV